MQLFTDASGSDGWGAYWSGRWLQDHWSPAQQQMNIAWKELYAIVMAVHTWGSLWQRQKILSHCDNQTVVNIWEKGSTKSPDIMALVRLLYFCAARYHIYIFVCNIFLVVITILLMLFPAFRMPTSGNSLRRLQQHQKPSLHGQPKPSQSPHAATLSWCRRINTSNIPVGISCLHIVLLSF